MEKRFVTSMRVRVGDLNYGGHLANDKYLLYFHEARVRFFSELGVHEADIGNAIGLTQVEAFVSYQGEAFLADHLDITVWVSEFSRVRFKTEYVIHRPVDNKQIASGYTILAAYNYQSRRPERIPSTFKFKVEQYQVLTSSP
jgi:acyl-CoA thioester hydrolase